MMIHLNELVLTIAIIAFLAAATTFTATQGLLYGQQAAPEDPLRNRRVSFVVWMDWNADSNLRACLVALLLLSIASSTVAYASSPPSFISSSPSSPPTSSKGLC